MCVKTSERTNFPSFRAPEMDFFSFKARRKNCSLGLPYGAEHLPALSLMADYLNPNLQIQYAGLEDIDGNPTHHLRLSVIPTDKTPPELADLMSEFHVWIDQNRLLALKTRHFDFSPEAIQNRTPVDIVYSTHRTGTALPFPITLHVTSQTTNSWILPLARFL